MRRRLRGVAFLAVLSQLLPYSQIARWAQAIVALGVATQGSRVYLGSVGRFRLLALRSALTVTLGIAVVTAGQRGGRTTQHRLQLSALPPSAAGSANVLLVILDTVREANLSLYGYARPTTPQLAERARDAVVFDRVFATAPWTLPSHATMMTGATPNDLRYDWRYPEESDGPTLAELLRDRGYLTGASSPTCSTRRKSRESGAVSSTTATIPCRGDR
ncbi:MAG: sulfatase-like hydrolase/transferase [Gemmatimonadetes bacterium]|nr:sulfatase-like hydrolase/transferase [Gemmatimonadota bacterium]